MKKNKILLSFLAVAVAFTVTMAGCKKCHDTPAGDKDNPTADKDHPHGETEHPK